MPTALIKLAYQQVIDASSSTPYEQQVFHATYQEFRIQQQSFSKGLDLYTWSAIKEKFPKSNPTLPFKVGFSIAGLVQTLDKKIPGLTDTLNIKPIHFVNHHFQLLGSDSRDASAHKVCIIYITDILTCFGSFGDKLLLALGDIRTESVHSIGRADRTGSSDGPASPKHAQPAPTFMLKLEDRLSIFSYEEVGPRASEISFPRPCALPSQASLFP